MNRWQTSAVLFGVLALAAFTHFRNLATFPNIFLDEGVYVWQGLASFDATTFPSRPWYFHPPMTWLLVGAVFRLLNFPASALTRDTQNAAVVSLLTIPHIVAASLSVVSTYLVFELARRRYSTGLSLFAAAIFAAAPATWLFRRVTLDGVMTTFLLASVLILLLRGQPLLRLFASAVFLSLAMLAKLTALIFLPPLFLYVGLQGYYPARRRTSLLWAGVSVLGPFAWAAAAWLKGDLPLMVRQLTSQAALPANPSFTFLDMLQYFVASDPVLATAGFIGLAYALARQEWLFAGLAVSYLGFLGRGGWIQYFHLLPLLPFFSILAARWLGAAGTFLHRWGVRPPVSQALVGLVMVAGLMHGAVTTTNYDLVSHQRQAIEYVLTHYPRSTIVVTDATYRWIFAAYRFPTVDWTDIGSIIGSELTRPTVFIVDLSMLYRRGDPVLGPQIEWLYNATRTASFFMLDLPYGQYGEGLRAYPALNPWLGWDGTFVEVRQGGPASGHG